MKRALFPALLAAAFVLTLAGSINPAIGVAQESLTNTYMLEIPQNPNAVRGFEGWGTIQYSPVAAGAVYLLVSVKTNTPDTTYWIMINPAPVVGGVSGAPTGDYRIFELKTDVNGLGYVAGQVDLPAGTWEFHGVMTADRNLHLDQ